MKWLPYNVFRFALDCILWNLLDSINISVIQQVIYIPSFVIKHSCMSDGIEAIGTLQQVIYIPSFVIKNSYMSDGVEAIK